MKSTPKMFDRMILRSTLVAVICGANAWTTNVSAQANTLTSAVTRIVSTQNVAQVRSTMRGEVTLVRGANRFDVRPDGSGKNFTVVNQGAQVGVTRGQIVSVTGTFNNDIFAAERVEIVNGGVVGQAGQIDVTGVVQSVSNNRNLTITQTGTTRRFVVQTTNAISRIDRGDTVRVRGTLRGNVISATQISKTVEGGTSTATRSIDITGRVVDMESAREFAVLVRSGVRYRVFSKTVLRNVQSGDTVRVQGERRANVAYTIDATSVIESAGDNNNTTGQGTLNLTGTIQNISNGRLIVVTDAARKVAARRYTLNFAGANANLFRKGQRVAVNGVLYSNNIVEANSVRVIR